MAQSLHALFERQAAKTPDAVALVYESKTLTYAELDARSNQLAHFLVGAGVRPDVNVALCLERSLDLVVAILGVLKAGGAYVPLDPEYPAERLRGMLADSKPPVLLTQSHVDLAFAGRVIRLDTEWGSIARHSAGAVGARVHPENAAYVIFTSGSTGRPKGVVIPHRAIVNHTAWMQKELPLEPSDALLQKTPVSFDASVFEFHAPLVAGARVVLAKPGGHRDVRYLTRTIDEAGITVLQVVPSLLDALLDEPAFAKAGTLRRLFCGGEPLTPALVQRFRTRSKIPVINLYGPTETAIDATFWSCPSDAPSSVPIGKPIDGVVAHVLDADMKPCSDDAEGELYLGGAGVGRGYLERPDLTAERFVPDPFASHSARMYRTGDVVRRRQGQLEYVGRADSQVKLRGFRIELGEIESVLGKHTAVRASAVVLRDDSLVAWVVPQKDVRPEATELSRFLEKHLPAHMVPTSFAFIDALPLGPSGKVDRRALPDVPTTDVAVERRVVAPRSDVEKSIAAMWIELLDLETVSVEDDFLELGGNSLHAMRIAARARQAFGVEIAQRSVFEHPTIASFAAHVAAISGVKKQTIARRTSSGPAPLSFEQQRFWFIEQMNPGPTYNGQLRIGISGAIAPETLRKNLAEIVRRHEVLRTVYVAKDGVPSQVVQVEVPVELPVTASSLGEVELDAIAKTDAQRVFDLEHGPIFRLRLVVLAPERAVLLFTAHHIAFDRWSTTILLGELAALQRGEQPPAPQIQYADYAVWQRARFSGDVLARATEYWKKKLAGAPELTLPTDRPRPATPSGKGARLPVRLDAALTQHVHAFGQHEGVTPFMTLLTALVVLLGRHARQKDVVIGSLLAGRDHAELQEPLGCFINTVALRVGLDGEPTISEMVRRVRDATLEAQRHDVPFDLIVETLRLGRRSRNPLFDVMFNFQNAPVPRGPVELVSSEMAPGTAMFDLTLELEESDGETVGCFEYNTDLFDAATIERFAAAYRTLLASMVDAS